MTTNNTFTAASTHHSPRSARSTAPRSTASRPRLARFLAIPRAIWRFYRVNWQRAAAQESEYLRLREEQLRTYWIATGGRM